MVRLELPVLTSKNAIGETLSMLERISRALLIADGENPDAFITKADQAACDREGLASADHAIPLWRQPEHLNRARAALEAVREPTEAMLRASPVVGTGVDAEGRWCTNTDPAAWVWRAMIDTAIGEVE